VPYNHSNLDSDEILYYVEGNYKARKGIEQCSITVHPQGIPHGPHPGTVEKSLGARETTELAVMCDTFRPMFPTKAAMGLDDLAYPQSWEGEHFPVSLGQHHADGAHRTGGAKSAGAKGKGAKGKGAKAAKAARPARKGGGTANTWD
jgi:homogentisate 1,2-dioxygenase